MSDDKNLPTLVAKEGFEFNAHVIGGVIEGHCVIVNRQGQIEFAGPIALSPDVCGKEVFMNAADYHRLRMLTVDENDVGKS